MDESSSNPTQQPRFADQVYEIVRRIPTGCVTTYGDIARALGDPRGARQVGWAIAGSPAELDVPFHRVVNRDGFLSGGWAFGHPEIMKQRLLADGVRFVDEYTVDMKRCRWIPGDGSSAADEMDDLEQSPPMITSGKSARLMIPPFRSTTTRRSWRSRPARNVEIVVPAGSWVGFPLMVAVIVGPVRSVTDCSNADRYCSTRSRMVERCVKGLMIATGPPPLRNDDALARGGYHPWPAPAPSPPRHAFHPARPIGRRPSWELSRKRPGNDIAGAFDSRADSIECTDSSDHHMWTNMRRAFSIDGPASGNALPHPLLANSISS